MTVAIALATLGCRSNHADTEEIKRLFPPPVFTLVPFDQEAQVYIVNTCTVTGRADRQSRQLLNRARRRNANALVIATGCYVSVDAPGLFAQVDGVFLVPGNRPQDILALVEEQLGLSPTPCIDNPCCFPHGLPRARPYLKVQDGCPYHCTYCLVSSARPGSTSLPLDNVRDEAQLMAKQGAKEIVITGIHLGLYGRDLPGRPSLSLLLREVARTVPHCLVRLSSLEPMDLDEALFSVIDGEANICHHLHLPVQSGSDAVLEAMGRPYTRRNMEDLVARAMSLIPDLTLGTDIIVGFPGETSSDFHQSASLVADLPFAYAHVFPYSLRPGTVAALLPDQVSEYEKKSRSAVLRQIAREKRNAWLNQAVGRQMQVVLEGRADDRNLVKGTSSYYHPVAVPHYQGPIPARVRVRAISVDRTARLLECQMDENI